MSNLPGPLRPQASAIGKSQIAELWEMGFGREGLIALWVGEGDEATPQFIGDAANAALKAGKTFYAPKSGIPELRQALADYGNRLYGSALAPERITVTSSGMAGLCLALSTVLGPGETMVVVDPIWPNIIAAGQMAGANIKTVPLEQQADGRFELSLEALEMALNDNTSVLFIASPGNPTGWVMDPDQQQAVLELCRKRRIWLIADEVYARFVYAERFANRPAAPSFLEIAGPDDPLIVLNSFSKAWAMTGWRMGWLTSPKPLADKFDSLVEFATSGAPNFLQYGCLAAIREGEPFVAELTQRCRRNARLVYERLSPIPGIRLGAPEGGFYSFFAVEGIACALDFAKQVLAETNVGLAPGTAFGAAGEGHLRLCFASRTEVIEAALDRLEPFFRRRL